MKVKQPADTRHAEYLWLRPPAIEGKKATPCHKTTLRIRWFTFETMSNLATKAGVEGNRLTIHTPLITLSKAQIIETGINLGVDHSLTIPCYEADNEGLACGACDSCRFRKQGFMDAGIPDPMVYFPHDT